MNEQTAIAFLTVQTRKQAVINATDSIIQNTTSPDSLSEMLFCCDAWFDIYGSAFHDKHIDFFEDEYHECPSLHQLEFGIWSMALVRNGREDWINALIL